VLGTGDNNKNSSGALQCHGGGFVELVVARTKLAAHDAPTQNMRCRCSGLLKIAFCVNSAEAEAHGSGLAETKKTGRRHGLSAALICLKKVGPSTGSSASGPCRIATASQLGVDQRSCATDRR
jgi:hypothetical protein